MHPIAAWTQDMESRLAERKARRLFRNLEPFPGGIDFASNDYLSLNRDGILSQFLQQMRPFPDVGSTGSRLIQGHRVAFERAEEAFAAWTQTESALLFHSGYAGNIGALQSILSPADAVFVDRLCHASLLDGIRLSGARRHYFHHNDLQHLEDLLLRFPPGNRGRRWIVTESVFSMDGDCPDLDSLLSLAEARESLVFLDEAHAVGVIGEQGRGFAFPRARDFAVLSYPMGKAPGLMGCFIAGPWILKDYLINNARGFIFTTAQPPFLADLLRRVVDLMPSEELQKRRDCVKQRAQLLHDLLTEKGFETTAAASHIVPVILEDEEKTMHIASFLKARGLSVFPIRPPTVPAGGSRLRISLHAGNTEAEVKFLVEQLVISRSNG